MSLEGDTVYAISILVVHCAVISLLCVMVFNKHAL